VVSQVLTKGMFTGEVNQLSGAEPGSLQTREPSTVIEISRSNLHLLYKRCGTEPKFSLRAFPAAPGYSDSESVGDRRPDRVGPSADTLRLQGFLIAQRASQHLSRCRAGSRHSRGFWINSGVSLADIPVPDLPRNLSVTKSKPMRKPRNASIEPPA